MIKVEIFVDSVHKKETRTGYSVPISIIAYEDDNKFFSIEGILKVSLFLDVDVILAQWDVLYSYYYKSLIKKLLRRKSSFSFLDLYTSINMVSKTVLRFYGEDEFNKMKRVAELIYKNQDKIERLPVLEGKLVLTENMEILRFNLLWLHKLCETLQEIKVKEVADKALAHEVLSIVKRLFTKFSIVGSIMRGHPEYHDLDFLITYQEKDKVYEIPDSEVIFESGQRISIIYKDKLQVDFFLSPIKSWELGRVAWGYGKANLHLRSLAKKKGCKLNQYHLKCGDEKWYKLRDIERILDVDLPDYLKQDVRDFDHVDEEIKAGV